MIGALLTTAAVWVYAARRLEPTPVAGLAPVTGEGPMNLLVVHTSSRDDERPASVTILQLADGTPPRALALPLDLEVTVPGAEATLVGDLLASGGPDRLVAAVADYTGVPLHHLVQVNLEGLQELATAVGGAACPGGSCLDEQIATVQREGVFPLDLLDEHAIGLRALAAEIGRPAILMSPLAVRSVVDATGAAIATDVDLGPRSALAVARALADSDVAGLDVRAVPGFHDPAAGTTTPYWEQAETLFQAFRNATAVPEDLGRTDPADDVLIPENVRVLVLNGIGVEGLAGRVAEHLEGAGFDVVGADNVETFDDSLERTVVTYRPGRDHEGELVAAKLEGSVVEERSELPPRVDVVVTVGNDWVER